MWNTTRSWLRRSPFPPFPHPLIPPLFFFPGFSSRGEEERGPHENVQQKHTPVPPLFQVHTRVKGIEDVKRTVFDNHEAVKAEIEREVDARVRANEEVLAALAHFTTALQDGVKIVGL